MTKNVDAIRRLFKALNSRVGNLASMPGIFPDYPAPIVRNAADGREIAMARLGMPSSQRALMDATKKRAQKLEAKGKTVDFNQLLKMEPDSGTTNIRNLNSAHWEWWLSPEHRCLVPFTSFSEYDTIDVRKVRVWFANDESRPLFAFAGLWTNWTSVRKAKEGEIAADIYGLLTCDPNAEVKRPQPQGDAGDPHHGRRVRCLDTRPVGRGQGAVAAASRRRVEDYRYWGERRPAAHCVNAWDLCPRRQKA
jgi:putative SOS response-associated peptidase YedK